VRHPQRASGLNLQKPVFEEDRDRFDFLGRLGKV
jgi:hypothetical protein